MGEHPEYDMQFEALRTSLARIEAATVQTDRAIRGENGTPGMVSKIEQLLSMSTDHERRIQRLEDAPALVINELRRLEQQIHQRQDSYDKRDQKRSDRRTLPGPDWLNRETLPWIVILALVLGLLVASGLGDGVGRLLPWTAGKAKPSTQAPAPTPAPSRGG